jgi:hypothetical protein
MDFCRSEKAKSRKPSHKVQGRKRTCGGLRMSWPVPAS